MAKHETGAESITYEVLRPIPWIGARPGDLILYRPEHQTHPVQLVRAITAAPNTIPWEEMREIDRRSAEMGRMEVLRG